MFHAAWNKSLIGVDTVCMTQTKEAERLVSTRVESDLAQRFTELARHNERSVSAELRIAMRDRLEHEKGKASA